LGEDDLVIHLPVELLERIDEIRGLSGFRSREEFVIAAVRRLLDRYATLSLRVRRY